MNKHLLHLQKKFVYIMVRKFLCWQITSSSLYQTSFSQFLVQHEQLYINKLSFTFFIQDNTSEENTRKSLYLIRYFSHFFIIMPLLVFNFVDFLQRDYKQDLVLSSPYILNYQQILVCRLFFFSTFLLILFSYFLLELRKFFIFQ